MTDSPKKSKKKKKAKVAKRRKFTKDDLCDVPTSVLVSEVASRVDIAIIDLRMKPDLDVPLLPSMVQGSMPDVFYALGLTGIQLGGEAILDFQAVGDRYRESIMGSIIASSEAIIHMGELLDRFDKEDKEEEDDEEKKDH